MLPNMISPIKLAEIAEGGLARTGKGHRLLEDVTLEIHGELDGEGVLSQPPQQVRHAPLQLDPHRVPFPYGFRPTPAATKISVT